MPFTSFRLTNGLTLWALPRPATGTISLALVLPVGGRHDPPRLLGLAHLVEHMAFSGTHRWSELQLRDEVEQRGGFSQARTTPESTTYFVHLPAGELAFGLRVLQQLVFAPTFPPETLPREKSIIAREAAPENSPLEWGLRLWLARLGLAALPEELIRHSLFAGTGLELPAIGFAKTRRRITLEDVCAYHARWYHPARAQLLVIGDFDPARLQPLAQRALGRLSAGENTLPPVSHPRPALRHRRYRTWLLGSSTDLKQSLGLPFSGASEAACGAIHLLARVIHDAVSERLRQQLGLLYSLQIEVAQYTDGGVMWLTTMVHYRYSRLLEQEVNAILDQLCAGEMPKALVERVRAKSAAEWTMALQSNDKCAEIVSDQPEVLLGQMPVLYSERLRTVAAEELRLAAARLLTRKNRQWLVHRPSCIGTTLLFIIVFLSVAVGTAFPALFLARVLWPALKAWLR